MWRRLFVVIIRLASECGAAAEYNVDTFRPLRDIDPQRRRQRTMESNSNPDITLQAFEAQIVPPRRDLAGVVEERHIHGHPVRDPAEFPRHQQAVTIAKPPAWIPAQRTAASERGQQEVWDRVVVIQRRLHEAMQ